MARSPDRRGCATRRHAPESGYHITGMEIENWHVISARALSSWSARHCRCGEGIRSIVGPTMLQGGAAVAGYRPAYAQFATSPLDVTGPSLRVPGQGRPGGHSGGRPADADAPHHLPAAVFAVRAGLSG